MFNGIFNDWVNKYLTVYCCCIQVFLVRKISGKDTGQVFAMKVLRKVLVICSLVLKIIMLSDNADRLLIVVMISARNCSIYDKNFAIKLS